MIVSKVDLKCGHPGCFDRISLHFETHHAYGYGEGHVSSAMIQAAVMLGWRRDVAADRVACPKHSDGFACVRCCSRRDDCSCMGGHRFDAVNAP